MRVNALKVGHFGTKCCSECLKFDKRTLTVKTTNVIFCVVSCNIECNMEPEVLSSPAEARAACSFPGLSYLLQMTGLFWKGGSAKVGTSAIWHHEPPEKKGKISVVKHPPQEAGTRSITLDLQPFHGDWSIKKRFSQTNLDLDFSFGNFSN